MHVEIFNAICPGLNNFWQEVRLIGRKRAIFFRAKWILGSLLAISYLYISIYIYTYIYLCVCVWACMHGLHAFIRLIVIFTPNDIQTEIQATRKKPALFGWHITTKVKQITRGSGRNLWRWSFSSGLTREENEFVVS